jgi:ribose/xylose/arabinose/galactoside ABC-type transport system permease subunit
MTKGNIGFLRRRFSSLNTLTILVVTVVLFVVLSATTTNFFSYSNIYSLLFGVSIQFFALIGFTFLMIQGEIDLSVGAMYGFAGAVSGTLVILLGIPLWPAIILTLLVAALVGFINGYLVVRFRIMSMMITIGMMSVLTGLMSILSTGLGAEVFPAEYRNLIKFKIAGIHWSILAFLLIVIVVEIFLNRSAIFRQMYYIGHNVETVRLYGIKADKVKITSFVVSSVTAAIGGILATSRITHAYPTTGLGLEFTMVTAAVLGGASLYGGKGSILRSVLGLLFLAIVSNGMIIYQIDPYLQQVLMGAVLIAAVFADTRLNARNT